MGADRMPAHLDAIRDLAALEMRSWPERVHALRASGVPLNDGTDPASTQQAAGEPAPAAGAPAAPPAPPAAPSNAGAPPVTPPAPVPTPEPEGTDADLLREASNPQAVSNALRALRDDVKGLKDENRELRLERDTVRVAAELQVPAEVLTGTTEAELRASAQTFIQHRDAAVQAAVAEAQAATAGLSGGARPRPVPQDLDAQIAEAEKSGDMAKAIRLKTQKLGTAPAPTA